MYQERDAEGYYEHRAPNRDHDDGGGGATLHGVAAAGLEQGHGVTDTGAL